MFISSLSSSLSSLFSSSVQEVDGNIRVYYKMLVSEYKSVMEPVILGYMNKNINDTGSYILVINSEKEQGATGIFCISRSKKSEIGYVNKLVANDGMYNEILNVEWDPYEYPKIILHIHKLNKDKIQNKREINFMYNIKII